MTPAIKIKTPIGLETYGLLMKQFNTYKQMGVEQLALFKTRCQEDYTSAESILGSWLDNDTEAARMDEKHPENWDKYNTMVDICESLKYFSMRRA